MRVQLLSDIHLEFYSNPPKQKRVINRFPVLAETLILAGDILSLKNPHNAEDLFRHFCGRWQHVVFVAGNHCYYGTDPAKALEARPAIEAALPNLHWLYAGKILELEGHRFLGDTLFFKDRPDNYLYQKQLTDFHVIKNYTPWAYEQNKAFCAFLDKELREGDIVVTHHAPHQESLQEHEKADPISRFYLDEQFELIADRKPSLWAHGHTHFPVDYVVASTRVVSNPYGYPSSPCQGFNPNLVIEI